MRQGHWPGSATAHAAFTAAWLACSLTPAPPTFLSAVVYPLNKVTWL
ncbi:hypothetical protein [Hymenobacter lapidarius]|nr:hypothetical protein [Hymenobacter lapidarius]